MRAACCICLLALLSAGSVFAQQTGDKLAAEYFALRTKELADDCLSEIKTLADWNKNKDEYRRQLFEMLGLDPLPEKTDLKATVTGQFEHEGIVVEKLHFQSRPGLYVTANLYRPQESKEKLPAILYVCGHGRVAKGNVSFGNKVHYHHHGAWFARNGYVCLMIDTLQLGEIEGTHHGTYSKNMWWWFNRGYTPAGVEAWNCIRALDYLETREEVDAKRIGVTGRSGGGAYSWWIAALDDRIRAAVPVAGITDLENHVVDGCVEGHCDCMYLVNTYRWDYAKVAALVAPRPLLISNTDRDPIFPLEGVVRIHAQVRRIYALHNAADKLGLHITSGPHQDTQELRIHAFRWFNHYLKGDDSLIEDAAAQLFTPEQLKVFETLPEDRKNTSIEETFTETAEPKLPKSQEEWNKQRDGWLQTLREKTFAAWPKDPEPLAPEQAFSVALEGVQLRAIDFTSQSPYRLRLYIVQRAGLEQSPKNIVLNVLDEQSWREFLATYGEVFSEQFKNETLPKADSERFLNAKKTMSNGDFAMAYFAPRGIGPTASSSDERKAIQIRRRFYLLGETADSGRVWDIRRAIQGVQADESLRESKLFLQSQRQMAGAALYASLFESELSQIGLTAMPASHRQGPYFLNVSRFLDLPQAAALAAERSPVLLTETDPQAWEYAVETAKLQQWDAKQFEIQGEP